ncbi:MAG: hypothetical protein J6V14_10155, partial [Clostridia bacterium]|nr:hypothetical protein [Clostridia bacterium]
QTQLNGLADSVQTAAKGADEVATTLNNISKKVSFDAVISGIGKITSGLEKAAQKAVEVGKQIWDNIMDSAAYADDVETLATRMGLTTTEVQQMQYVANRFEAPVETVAKSWKKVKMSMTSDSEEIAAGFANLGVQTQEFSQGKMGAVVTGMRDYKDVFWETGEAIMRMTDEAEQERLAQQLLGRSWDEMIPLFKAGREEYEAAMESAPVVTEEAIQNAAELSDKVYELETSFRTLKTQVIGEIAPTLTGAATTLEKLITSVTDYLQTDAGQEALQNMADAVSGLFEDLGKIDPAQVVEGFTGVFNTVVEGLQWLDTNKDVLSGVLTTIVTGWGLAKLAGGALDVLNLINGLRGLNAASAAAAGEAAGAAWGGGFANAVAAAAPWLVGAYMLLNPSGGEVGYSDDPRDANGNLVGTGFTPWNDAFERWKKGESDNSIEREVIDLVADRFMGLHLLFQDQNAIQIMDNYLRHQNLNQLEAQLEYLGYEKIDKPQGERATDGVGNRLKMNYIGQATQKITGEEQVLPGEIAEIGGALDSSADAQSSASDAMNSAAATMEGLPAAVAAAIQSVKLT